MLRSLVRRPGLACWLCVLTGLAFAALLVIHRSARAAWPPDESKGPVTYSDPANWPNDPGYGGSWELWSFVPDKWAGNVTEQNKRLGTGAHVDRAWAKTIGDRRILISVLDSGANWSNDDLVNKWHLNDGELPPPKDCAGADGMKHDANGDGYFNVQDYTSAKGHELPSFDKVCDLRVKAKGDVNQNGILDPQDLIAAFSDGKDDDANGYVDDICGWDFYRNDNDPMDDTGYGHGNGEASDSTNEGNNGRGDIGTCPECTVQLLRCGDSFIADMNNFGMAVLYAVDSGSSVVQEALGTIDNTALGKAAIDYAYANNVVVIASMADEDSYHHNFPAANNHTFTVHATTHDSESIDTSATFLNFNNCTDYGAQLMASVPGGACSSEATGKSSGMAGLLYAAALQANVPAPPTGHAGDPKMNRRVSAEEVMQLFIAGIDDIYDPADASDPSRYATRVGWEQRFGYGRVNARAAVDRVLDGRIPPEVELRAPEHFEVIYPERTPKVPILGRVAFRNQPSNKFGDSVDFVLEYAPGIEPDDGAWKPIASGTKMAQGMDGTLAMWDVSGLTVDNPAQSPPDLLVNRFMVTVRLRATVHSQNPKQEGLVGTTRRGVFIVRDPDLMPGYPVHVGTSGEASLKMYDLDGDGKRELIDGDSNGRIHAYRADGTELPGWPALAPLIKHLDPAGGASHAMQPAFAKGGLAADTRNAILGAPAIGDIDGDGKAEIVIADYGGSIYAFHADGKMAKGWPQTVDRSIVMERMHRRHKAAVDDAVFASPALADFNGDGMLDIVIADGVGELTVWKGDGTKLPGWPVRIWDTSLPDDPAGQPEPRQANRIVTAPALGDLDGDGVPDIVVGSNESYESGSRVYAVSGKTAAILPGWPIIVHDSTYVLPVVGSGMPNAASMADLNGDGVPEIVVGGIGGSVRAFDKSGKPFGRAFPNSKNDYGPMSNFTDPTVFPVISNPAFGDLDDDGVTDLVFGVGGTNVLLAMATGGKRKDFQFGLGAWDGKTGAFKPGFPQQIEDYQFFLSPLVADVDGDGHTEVINGSAGYFLHAFNANGVEAKGFPKFTGQWIASTPVLGDMDGDGKLELACHTREGWVYAWHTGGTTKGRIDWDSMRHDQRNTGNFATPLDQGSPAMPGKTTMPPMPSGCSCGVAVRGARGSGMLALLALLGVGGLGLGRARRRSRRS